MKALSSAALVLWLKVLTTGTSMEMSFQTGDTTCSIQKQCVKFTVACEMFSPFLSEWTCLVKSKVEIDGWLVQKILRDARLLLARRPPCFNLDLLLYGRHWGLSRWRLVQLPPLRDRAASDQGPGHLAVLTGSSLHGGPQWNTTVQPRTYRNLCCTVYDAYVPAWHLRIVMWRC